MTCNWLSAIFVITCVVHIIAAQSPNTHGTAGQRGGNVDTSNAGLSPDDIQTILAVHNEARKTENAVEMPDLVWADGLASNAQNWTNGCVFAHQPPRARQWGENIAAVGNTRSKSGQLSAMITEWVGEKKHNVGGTFEECCSFRVRDCCHYTQVIWAETLKVGCGYTVCSSLDYQNTKLNNIAFLACYYTPSGNRPKVSYDWKPYEPKKEAKVTPA